PTRQSRLSIHITLYILLSFSINSLCFIDGSARSHYTKVFVQHICRPFSLIPREPWRPYRILIASHRFEYEAFRKDITPRPHDEPFLKSMYISTQQCTCLAYISKRFIISFSTSQNRQLLI